MCSKGDDSGSVSMETIMDTVTRVFSSVVFLSFTFSVLHSAWTGVNSNLITLSSSGSQINNAAIDYINSGHP